MADAPSTGPMYEQKVGRLIITTGDPEFDGEQFLGGKVGSLAKTLLGDGGASLPNLLPSPPSSSSPPLPPHAHPPPPMTAEEQEALELEMLAEAIAAPLIGPDGEDRSVSAPREESGAGRKDVLEAPHHHAHPHEGVNESFFRINLLPLMEVSQLSKNDPSRLFQEFDLDGDGLLSADEQHKLRPYMQGSET